MLQSGSGAWGVYRSRHRDDRFIGKNNTFRTFREACVYALFLDRYYAPTRMQYGQCTTTITRRA